MSPPQQVLVATSGGSQLHGSGIPRSYEAVSPLTVDTISRHIYWYNNTTDCVMMHGSEIHVSVSYVDCTCTCTHFHDHCNYVHVCGKVHLLLLFGPVFASSV